MLSISICAVCSGQHPDNKWLPRSIAEYRQVVLARFDGEPIESDDKLYPVFSNVAYNLQYLEYINKCFGELYLTSVIRSQNVKMFTLTVSQIIECFLYVKLIEMKVDPRDIWDFVNNLRVASQKNAFGMGSNFYHGDMKWLKDLRNKIHIQSPADIAEADYAIFDLEVLNRSKSILWQFLQKSLSMPTDKMNQTFEFLAPTNGFIHSKSS